MDVLTDLTGISLKEDYIMNFKTIAIAVSATATIAAGVMTFRAHKLSKQEAVEYDMTDEEISELSTEELQSMIDAARVEEEAIAAAPKATKVFGMLTLISAVTLTAFIISNAKSKDLTVDTSQPIAEEFDLQEAEEEYLEHAKAVANALGTSIKKSSVDPETHDIYFELEDDSKADEFIELITEKVNE